MLLIGLVTAFAFSLTACGGSTNNSASPSSSPSTSPSASQASSSAEESPSASSNELEFDLGGRTITMATWWDATPFGDTESSKKILQNIADLEKEFNFKWKFEKVDYGQIAEKTASSVLAGQPFADIVRLEQGMAYPGLVNKGILQPIEDILMASGAEIETFIDPFVVNTSTFNGKLYGWSDNPYFTYSGVLYNRTLLQKLGMKDLSEYVKDGTWTWDKFKEVAAQATQGDTYGLADFSGNFLEVAMVSNGTDLVDLAANKQALDDPKTVEALQFTQDVMNSNIFPKGVTTDWQAPGPAFRKGNVLMYNAFNWQTVSVKSDMGDVDIGFVPYPKGPSATQYYSNAGGPNFWTIPKGVKDPEKVLYLYRKIYDVPADDEYPGQTSLESTYTNDQDIQMAIEASKNLRVLNYKLFMSIYSNDFYGMVDDLTVQKKSPAAATEARKSIFQKALDDTAATKTE